MKAKAGILIIICFVFLVGTVAAVGIPDTVTVTTDKAWIIANNGDQSTITVKVTNTTPGFNGEVQGVTVNLAVDPQFGTLNPATISTNLSGMASSTFKVKTKSGAPQITATINAPVLSNSTIQNIDHDSPYYPYFSHQLSGTVASEVPFNISITDRWGNPIDIRRGPHNLTLEVHGPMPDDCGFAEAGYNHTVSQPLDANGNASVMVRLTTKVGPNNILVNAFGSIPDKLEWINADTNGVPFSMTQFVSPSGSPPSIPADGTSFFTIVYTLFDKYGNPTNEQSIWVNTSVPGEEKKFLSNNLGQVVIQYGPRSSIGIINITTTAVANSTYVTMSQEVQFTNTGAEIISLTANPDNMASNDVNPTLKSNIIATVADHSGNAVIGESVNFYINNITYDANATAPPILLNSSAITDEYGQAVVQFMPGNFTTIGNPGYNATATGHCELIAIWNGTQKIVPVTWKNYPYLSVRTSVTPLTVEINKTIDVTIEFRGDGWAMQSKPVDVLLLLDNSGSMGTSSDSNSGLSQSKRAAITFIDQMTPGNDRVGVIFYDKKTYPNFSVYVPLTYNLNSVKNSISGYTRSDTKGYHTRTRYALYQGVRLMNNWNDRGAVPAIIHMTDGQWSMEGDPLARAGAIGFNQTFTSSENQAGGLHSVWAGNVVGVVDKYRYFDDLGEGTSNYKSHSFPNGQPYDSGTTWVNDVNEMTQNYNTKTSWYFTDAQNSNQNMSVYANKSGIRVYSIGFTPTANKADLNLVLQTMSNATGGFYKYAPTESDLKNVYKEIAEDLKNTAGVNTTMTADFENINVTGITMPGDQVFDYVYNPAVSTKITWQNGTTTVPAINQSDDWNADNKLDFSIGTIKVGQFWNATFRLRVNQSGLIDVFGKNSTVSFNGGKEILNLPQTFITVVPNLNATVIGAKKITLTNLTVTENGEIKALLPVMWNMNYTGNNTVIEKIYYSIDNGNWILFATKSISGYAADPTLKEYVEYAQLDVTKLPPGGYKIMVYATAPDATDVSAITDVKLVGGKGKTFIKLE